MPSDQDGNDLPGQLTVNFQFSGKIRKREPPHANGKIKNGTQGLRKNHDVRGTDVILAGLEFL